MDFSYVILMNVSNVTKCYLQFSTIGLAKEGFKTEETPMGLLFSFSRLKPRLKARLSRHFSPNQKSSCCQVICMIGTWCTRPLPAPIIRQQFADHPTVS